MFHDSQFYQYISTINQSLKLWFYMLSCLLISPLGCLIGISILTCPEKMFNTLSNLFLSVSHSSAIGAIFPSFSRALFIDFSVLHSFRSISKFDWFCLQIMPWFHLLFYRSVKYLLCNPPPRLLWLLKLASNRSAYFTSSSLPICCLFRNQYHLKNVMYILYSDSLGLPTALRIQFKDLNVAGS